MIRQTRSAWAGAYPIFILSLVWNGRTFYCSTKPLVISSADGYIQLQGGMTEDPEFKSMLPNLGFSIDSYSTSIACYLLDVDLAEQAAQHNTLENASAELSYILVSDTDVESYDDRTILLKGLIKEPIIGHRDRSNGYFEASIEAPVLDTSLHSSSMGQGARISPSELSELVHPTISPLSAIQDANYILELLENHKEKVLPIILGAAGTALDKDMNLVRYGATPAYVLYATSGSTNKIYLALAPHDVKASRVRIYDDLGNWRVSNVNKWIRNDGRVFCYVEFTHSSGGFQNPVDDTGAKYYVSWFDGGGLISSRSAEAITGAADVCRWILEQGQQPIDYQAWETVAPYLNSYKIAGYINNEEITPIQFLENEIIPLLPISVIQGVKGMKPVLDLLAAGTRPRPIIHLDASPEFSAITGIQQQGDSSGLINDFTIKYAYDLKQQTYQAKHRLTGDTTLSGREITQNLTAVKSFRKYGSRPKVLETSFVVDTDTAALIAFNHIANYALPQKIITYKAAARFGWLETGDIISLTDQDMTFNYQILQIISKTWSNISWVFTLRLYEV